MLGKVEGTEKRGRPNLKRIESMKKAIAFSLHDLNKAVN